MAIRENATVNVIGGPYKGGTGKVVRVYDTVGIGLVQLENGDLGKVYLSEMIEIRPQEPATEPEIPKGAKKISRADFDAALIRAITSNKPDTVEDVMDMISTAIVGGSIGSEIFKTSDVAVMTEAEFIDALWDGCRPRRVGEIIDTIVDVRQSLTISIASAIIMEMIPGILFGGDNG